MTITATFSNGFIDTYKGDRDVRAAWAIISKADGKVLKSGHSIDRAKAASTAAGKLQELHCVIEYGHPLYYLEGRSYLDTAKTRRAKRQHNADRLAYIAERVTIEIIDL